ncbi:MAG: hypothetical protein Q4A01_11080 [Coriobacteriales bacterium]|nr:hypothetical protein [Coriobacteriales bacterium]
MTMHVEDNTDYRGDAPRPVDADSVANGSFEHLGEGQGAVSASQGARTASHHPHGSQEEGKPISKRVVAIIIVGAVLAIAVSVFLFVRILSAASAAKAPGEVVEQTVVSREEPITYRGYTYELVKGNKGYALEETQDSGNGKMASLGDLPGDPVCLVLFNGALIIPENLEDGTWDVMAYTIGSGWSQIMDHDGNVLGGEGTIAEGTLDGSNLKLQVDDDVVDIPLEW